MKKTTDFLKKFVGDVKDVRATRSQDGSIRVGYTYDLGHPSGVGEYRTHVAAVVNPTSARCWIDEIHGRVPFSGDLGLRMEFADILNRETPA